jgi:molecular chaperone DnaJ
LLVKDYYTILGVAPQASIADIKKAYRRLALQYHPDTNQNDPYALAQFTEIKEAWEVLGSPSKRQTYHEERWYLRSQGGRFAQNQALTPVTVLKQLLRLENDILSQDGFRMDGQAMTEKAMEIISKPVTEKLAAFDDPYLEQEIVKTGMRIAGMLSYKHSHVLWQRLQVLAAAETSLQIRIEKEINRQKRQAWLQRWQWAAVVVIAIGICLFIKLVAG